MQVAVFDGLVKLLASNVMIGAGVFLLIILTGIAAGIVIPIIAKFFMWFGVTLHKT